MITQPAAPDASVQTCEPEKNALALGLTDLSSGPRHIHLIGVAGSGMSGIAGLLLALGHRVSGSDKVTTAEVERLQGEGLDFRGPQTAAVIRDAETVIYSSAIRAGNAAFDEALRLGKPLLRRAEALAGVMHAKQGIVVAGMHGKTTTSSMIAHTLRVGGLRPSHYVGAEIPILGTNAHWQPESELFVAEGDESDGTLVCYHPEYTVLLNIEEEHLDFYRDLAAIEAVYTRLCSQTRGSIFYCKDDPHAARVAEQFGARGVAFGADDRAHYHYGELTTREFQTRFTVYRGASRMGDVVLNVPGVHNVTNALSVVALATELGVAFPLIVEALDSFRGARRRFEFKHRGPDGTLVVDDYGHHPSEIRATLETARANHSGRIVTLFQPHRYSRTQCLKKEFGRAFGAADTVVISDVYPASEAPIPGVTGQLLVDELGGNGHPDARYEPRFDRLPARIGALLRPGDLFLTLGAGNIHEVGSAVVSDLKHLAALREALAGDGEICLHEPLARHTTLRVGGPARFWAEPTTEAAFARLVRYARTQELPIFVIGRGSNLLVRDGGIDGLVIHPVDGEFARLEVHPETFEISAGVGVGLKRLAGAAAKSGIGGFEWMDGIPGAVGGSLRMNAGAMGTETFDQVVSVRLLDEVGMIVERTPAELEVNYRSVTDLRQKYALAARFRGQPSTPEAIKAGLAASFTKRKTSQPIAASAGCIFKNPARDLPAGKLVDSLGLKNSRIGAARVSEVHGNFIVNDGGASAQEVLALIARIQETALRERGVVMEPEVQIVGKD